MHFAFTEEQLLIRENARSFFDEHATSERLRAAIDTDAGYDPALWQRTAVELGWAGIAIPERHGGSGLGMLELAILQQEHGRRLVASPFFSTVCLAVPLILQTGALALQSDWLAKIATGGSRVAVALGGLQGCVGTAGISAQLHRRTGEYQLDGESGFVIHGHSCDALLIAARRPGTTGEEGVSLLLLDPKLPGITVRRLESLDRTRPMAHLRFEGVPVRPEEILGEEGSAGRSYERALDFARIALAAEALGAAEWTLETTTRYVKERIQFGRPIGSFQAVKHRLADMSVLIEAAKSAAWYAACVADECPAELAEAASTAKVACCDALLDCAANAIQLHGGIGFTWEHDAHLYFKRARAAAMFLGSPDWHRERLAGLIGLGETTCVPRF